MSMYDDLDPMFEPSPAAALDNVAARVHTLMVRRRMAIAGAIGTVALATALLSATFASGASGHTARISVADTSTSTTSKGNRNPISTGAVTTTTGPVTSTSVRTTSPRPISIVPRGRGAQSSATGQGATGVISTGPLPTVPIPTTTSMPTTTTIGSNGPAEFRVVFAIARLEVESGTSAGLTYAITNVGGTTGYLDVDPCNLAQPLWPTVRGLWPSPVSPTVSCAAALVRVPLAPGRSRSFTHTLAGGRFSGANLVPAYPGVVVFVPPELPVSPATATEPNGLPVTITAPATAPFTANRPTAATVASGKHVLAPFSLTNNLPFTASYEFVGPRTHPRATTTTGGPCVGDPVPHHFTAFRCTVTVAGRVTVAMDLDLWATDSLLPPNPPSVLPLTPGVYSITWNEISLQLTVD